MKSRIKCTRSSTEDLVNCINAWRTSLGESNIVRLLEDVEPFKKSRALPSNKILVQFLPLGIAFRESVPNLKPSHVETYDALVEMHIKTPCLGVSYFSKARDCSALLRVALAWYRSIKKYPQKREQILRDGTDSERKAIFAFSDSVQLDVDGFDITVGGTAIVRNNSSTSTHDGSVSGRSSSGAIERSNSFGSIMSCGDESGLEEINVLLDEVLDCTATSKQHHNARPAVAAIDRGRHAADAFGMMGFFNSSSSQ